MKNILFIIPHPDDEIVGSCCIIKRYISNKKNIFLFFVTNGVISSSSSWFWNKKKVENMIDIRKKEMKLSVKKLGVKTIYFQNISTRTLKDKILTTYDKIRKIIISQKIDALFCPAYEGGHQDHDVSNFICSKTQIITGRVDLILKSFFCIKANTSLSMPIDIPVEGQSRLPKLLTRLSYLPPPPIDPNCIFFPFEFFT